MTAVLHVIVGCDIYHSEYYIQESYAHDQLNREIGRRRRHRVGYVPYDYRQHKIAYTRERSAEQIQNEYVPVWFEVGEEPLQQIFV
jgi:hypothetical protein